MFIRMCSALPWSHAALSTVHQRPAAKIGRAPLAPKTKSASLFGARMPRPRMPTLPLDQTNVSA
jgi:hypothetical protein